MVFFRYLVQNDLTLTLNYHRCHQSLLIDVIFFRSDENVKPMQCFGLQLFTAEYLLLNKKPTSHTLLLTTYQVTKFYRLNGDKLLKSTHPVKNNNVANAKSA